MLDKNYLYIYPTSRAIRAQKEEYRQSNELLPPLTTISEFEQKAILLGNSRVVDSSIRAIILKESADFSEFKSLKSDLNLLKFYSKSDDFFRFFEEVSAEGITIKELYYSDSYAEFERDLEILQKLLDNYKQKLQTSNLIDKIFIPKLYSLNRNYINSFDGFVLELEGYLTKFELDLIEAISKIKPFIVKLRSTKYNLKVVNSFKSLGIDIPPDSYVEFNLSTKEIIKAKKEPINIDCEVIEVSNKLEQVAVAFSKVEEFVQRGIEPKDIVIVLPDESMASVFKSYDSRGNLNFAMGESYIRYSSYLILDELYKAISRDKFAIEYLKRNGIEFDIFSPLYETNMGVDEFFMHLRELSLPLYGSEDFKKELDKLNLLESYFKFTKVFESMSFSFKEWLFLWLERLKKHTIDDVNGGKVTVMGLLESRGVDFEGVVVVDFNDDKVPLVSNKDRFLNSLIRANAKLPTKEDRENLQKYYYTRLLERAKISSIVYQSSDEAMPSKFLYELGLDSRAKKYKVPLNILYKLESRYNPKSHEEDIEVLFNASNMLWSATKLKSFIECKRKFYYRYIRGLKEVQSSEINEGRELHDVLSKVITPNRVFSSVDELKREFMMALDSIDGDIELLYKKPLWSRLLEPFFKQTIEHFSSGWSVADREFEVQGVIEGLRFSGRIDRLDKKDNLNLVIDYKSGSIKAANQKDVEKVSDFQMNIYAKLLDKPNTNFAFLELFNGDLTYLDGFEEKEAKLLEHIEYLKSSKSFSATRCDNLQTCRYCPYQLLCHRGEYL